MEIVNTIMPVLIFILTLATGCIGWFAGQMWNRLKAIEDKHADYKLTVADNYVRHDRMQEIIKPMATSISDVQMMVGELLRGVSKK